MAVDDHLAEIGVMVEQGKELGAALVSEEHLLSIITALCDVEGIVRGSESWFAWHLTNKVDFTGHSSPLFCEKQKAPGGKGTLLNRQMITITYLGSALYRERSSKPGYERWTAPQG